MNAVPQPHDLVPSLTSLSRRRVLALGGLCGAALLAGPDVSTAQAAGQRLDISFDGGWLGPKVTASEGASVARAYSHSGGFGCRLNPATTDSRTAHLAVDRRGFAPDQPYASFIMFFRLVTAPSAGANYMNLFEIGSTSTSADKSQFTVFFRGGQLWCDFGAAEAKRIGPMPSLGEWHMVQAVVHYGSTTYTARVRLDSGPVRRHVSVNDKTPQNVRALWLHYAGVAVDYTMDVDDISMVTSSSDPGFLSPTSVTAAASGSFAEAFQGGAPGTAPTSLNTRYDEVLGDRGVTNGTVAAAFARDGLRGQCMRFWNTRISRSTFGFLGRRVGPTTSLYLRRYYKLDRLPQYRTGILLYKYGGNGNGQLGGTHNGSFALGGRSQSNRFTLVDRDATATVSRSAVPVNEWFRIETRLDFASGRGRQTAQLFLGSNLHGTTPTETIEAALTGPYVDYLEDGILTNPNVLINVRVDEAVNGPSWPGPAV